MSSPVSLPQVFQHDSVLYVVPRYASSNNGRRCRWSRATKRRHQDVCCFGGNHAGGRRTAVRLARADSQRRNEVSEKALFTLEEWARRDSNPGPPPCHGGALTN